MDIVYVIGGDLEGNDNLSLRYSLRSLAKNGINVDRVIVAGPKLPDWLSDNVIKFEVSQDPIEHKSQRIFSTILAVNDNFSFPESGFLISMDDHIISKPVDFNDYPFYNRLYPKRSCKNFLPTEVEPQWISPDYAEILKDTGDWLRDNNYTTYNMAIHRNMHMFPNMIKKHRKEINKLMDPDYPKCIEMICVVLNMYISDIVRNNDTVEICMTRDFKTQNPSILKKYLKYSTFVSTCDYDSGSETHILLDKTFPIKCKYEK